MNSKLLKVITGLALVLAITAYAVGSTKAPEPKKLVLTSDNTVILSGEINEASVGDTIQALQALDSKTFFGKAKPIHLVIYSPGGSIQDGLILIEAIKGLNRPVDTAVLFAASMGWQVTQGVEGERYIVKNGIMMSHRAAGGFQGSFGGQYPSQIDSRYNFWKQRLNELDQQTVARSKGKQTLQSYQDQYKSEMWLTGSQSVEQGYSDSIVSLQCDKTLQGTTKHSTSFMGMEIDYELSACPLITAPKNVHMADKYKNGTPIDVVTADQIKTKFIESLNLENTLK
jgi:ATP-dependent protease ClpP protease subunit